MSSRLADTSPVLKLGIGTEEELKNMNNEIVALPSQHVCSNFFPCLIRDTYL